MNPIRLPKHPLTSVAAALLGLAFASGAPAQSGVWKWLDAQGRTVYSDLPPPPGVRITQLKAPGGLPGGVSSTTPPGHSADAGGGAGQSRTSVDSPVAQTAAPEAAEPASSGAGGKPTAATPVPASASAPASWVEREKQSRQRAAERAEAEARDAEESRRAADLDRSCDEARTGLRTLESGQRVQVVDTAGQRVVLDDAERTRRTASLRRMLSENCERQPS